MWFHVIWVSIFPYVILGLAMDGVNLSIDYFKYRNMKQICLLTCRGDSFWSPSFSKLASNHSIAVSEIHLDQNNSDFNSVQKCLEYELQSVGVLMNANCEGNANILYFASEHLYFTAQHKWLIIENSDAILGSHNSSTINTLYSEQSIIGVFDYLNISVDADVMVALRDNTGYYILHDVFNFGKVQGGHVIAKEIGSWGVENRLNLDADLNEYKYYRRWDFQNWKMRMILVVTPAPKEFDMNRLSNLKPIPGVAIITQTAASILNIIAEMHNFRFIPAFADRWIGTFERNTSNSSVVADSLYFKEQDISPVIRYLTTIHENIGLLRTPLTDIGTKYYYRIPSEGPGKFENQFLMPLSPVAWWGVIGVLVLCAFLLLLSARLEHRPSSVQYAVFSVIATICQQFYEDIDDGVTRRTSSARKTTILVTGLSCVLIYNYYTSSVVSWLLNGPPPSINSLEELRDSPLELIYEDVGYTRSWLQIPTYYYNKRNARIEDELRQKKVFNKKKDAPLLVPLVEGIRMVQKGGYAYHTEINSANLLISKTFDQSELCELGSLQSMVNSPLYPAVQKDSPYNEFLSWSLMRLVERGFVSCIQARTAAREVKCEGSSPRALALGGAAPAFILLAGGYLLAIFIMLIERFVYKMKYNNHETLK